MVRAAAKNHPSVAVVVDPLGYDGVLAAVRAGGFTLAERKILASLAFRHTAEYDVAVASWMGDDARSRRARAEAARLVRPRRGGAPACSATGRTRISRRRSTRDDAAWPGLAQAEQLHGKEMSYNNFTDADAAWRAAFDHEEICVAIIKHANPCGIAISSVSVADAHRKAHECDPLSAFGGVIAANTTVSVEMAETVADIFTEVDHRACLRRRRGGSACAQEEHPRAGGVGAVARRRRDASDQRRAVAAAARRARRAGRRPGELDVGHGRTGRPCDACRPRLRVAVVPGGEVERDRRRRGRRHRRRRHGPGEPGRRGAAGGRARRATGCAARWRPPTRSSRSRTAWRRWPMRV